MTPRSVLRDRLILLLATDPDGLKRSEALRRIGAEYADQWTAEDLVPNPHDSGKPRWQNSISWERKNFVDDDVIAGPDNGVWKLTSNGQAKAKAILDRRQLLRESADVDWTLTPGVTMSRRERMERFGGGRQGGIEPSSRSQNVFVYSDPAAGKIHGYTYDGWSVSGDVFLYTGEGPSGDQRFTAGNKAIRDHVSAGRVLRLFIADGVTVGTSEKIQTYIGKFSLSSLTPFVRAEAPGADGLARSVIVFRLVPTGDVHRRVQDNSVFDDASRELGLDLEPEAKAASVAHSTEIPEEQNQNKVYDKKATSEAVARRREADLVDRFRIFAGGIGYSFTRYKVRPPGEIGYLYTDIADQATGTLYEVKATSTREAVRMALAQLLDYRRHLDPNLRHAVLLPSRPSEDLISLLREHSVACVYETTNGAFVSV